jgi:hypothetical protein
MANFAELDGTSIVIRVIAVNNDAIDNLPFPESEPIGVEFCQSLFGTDTVWKQTSFSRSFRKLLAATGYSYDPISDAFVPPKPFPSWVLSEKSGYWDAPVPYPKDGKHYIWDEATLSWVEIPAP